MAKQPKSDKPAAGAAEVTYVPGDGDPVTVVWGGMKFEANKPREVTNPQLIAKAKLNPWFKVAGEKAAAKADPSAPPKTAEEYRGFAIAWINAATTSGEMSERWEKEGALREACGVGSDDLDLLGGTFNPKLEKLKKAESA